MRTQLFNKIPHYTPLADFQHAMAMVWSAAGATSAPRGLCEIREDVKPSSVSDMVVLRPIA